MYKTCPRCERTLEYEFFYKNARAKDGCSAYCKECQKEYNKNYGKTHKVEKRRYAEQYKKKHQEELNEYHKEYYQRTKEVRLAYQKKYNSTTGNKNLEKWLDERK